MTKSILEVGKILTGKNEENCKEMAEEGKNGQLTQIDSNRPRNGHVEEGKS